MVTSDSPPASAGSHCCCSAGEPTSASSGAATATDLDDRIGQPDPTRLLEQQHEVELGQAETAEGLGHLDPEHAHLGQRRPHVGQATVVVDPRVAHLLGLALLVEQVAHGVAEQDLVVGEGEAHRSAYFLGRPSTRSAMTLRWISLVPA